MQTTKQLASISLKQAGEAKYFLRATQILKIQSSFNFKNNIINLIND